MLLRSFADFAAQMDEKANLKLMTNMAGFKDVEFGVDLVQDRLHVPTGRRCSQASAGILTDQPRSRKTPAGMAGHLGRFSNRSRGGDSSRVEEIIMKVE